MRNVPIRGEKKKVYTKQKPTRLKQGFSTLPKADWAKWLLLGPPRLKGPKQSLLYSPLRGEI